MDNQTKELFQWVKASEIPAPESISAQIIGRSKNGRTDIYSWDNMMKFHRPYIHEADELFEWLSPVTHLPPPESDVEKSVEHVDDLLSWVAIFYGALKELVELKDLKETLYKGNHDGKEYTERKPLAWNLARQAIELWKKSDYGALPPPEKPLHNIREIITAYWKFDNNQQPQSNWHDREDLIEIIENHFASQFTTQYPAKVYSIEKEREPVIGEVWKSKGGRKFVVAPSILKDMEGRLYEYEYVCAKAHDDGDFSYLCTFQWCRCSD